MLHGEVLGAKWPCMVIPRMALGSQWARVQLSSFYRAPSAAGIGEVTETRPLFSRTS